MIFFASFTAVQSLNSLNDQLAQFMVTSPCSLNDEDEAFVPGERDTLRKSMTLMRHLLVDAQVKLDLECMKPLTLVSLTIMQKTYHALSKLRWNTQLWKRPLPRFIVLYKNNTKSDVLMSHFTSGEENQRCSRNRKYLN